GARETPLRSALARLWGRVGASRWPSSSRLHPLQSSRRQCLHASELIAQLRAAGRGQLIRPPAVVRFHRLDQALLLQPRERRIERARAELDPGDLLDVGDHRVAVLGSLGQADQDQQPGVGEAAQSSAGTRHHATPFVGTPTTSTIDLSTVDLVAATCRHSQRAAEGTDAGRRQTAPRRTIESEPGNGRPQDMRVAEGDERQMSDERITIRFKTADAEYSWDLKPWDIVHDAIHHGIPEDIR